jgi:predicted RNA-binding Zn-ribbon protein involved in translation (DUF1610 family)
MTYIFILLLLLLVFYLLGEPTKKCKCGAKMYWYNTLGCFYCPHCGYTKIL